MVQYAVSFNKRDVFFFAADICPCGDSVCCLSWSPQHGKWVVCVFFFLTIADKKCRANAYFDLFRVTVSSPLRFLSQRLGQESLWEESVPLLHLLAPPAHYVLTLKPHYKNVCMALHLKQVDTVCDGTVWCAKPTHTNAYTHTRGSRYLFISRHTLGR